MSETNIVQRLARRKTPTVFIKQFVGKSIILSKLISLIGNEYKKTKTFKKNIIIIFKY